MAHEAGSALYATFQDVPITPDFRSFDVSESLDVADTTAGADVSRSHVATVDGADISLVLLYNGTAGTAVLGALALRQAGTLIWGPDGTATGQPKYECQATVTGFDKSHPYAGEQMLNVTLLRNGPWVGNYDSLGTVW